MKKQLLQIYGRLRKRFGHQNWWPGETPLEVMIGAILTQNTSWTNVEKAISNLKKGNLLNLKDLLKIGEVKLAKLIKPSGYFNQKAKKLKNFARFIKKNFNGSVKGMKRLPLKAMREKLLSVKGIGPETADSMLLYALGKRIFVVDAYTKRILSRIGLCSEHDGYPETQKLFMDNIPGSLRLYNDYHAQLVMLGKSICRKKPNCPDCPLEGLCGHGKALASS